ncbi:hypothetical protein THAOC_20403, partial [Thalassiosira oceanica]
MPPGDRFARGDVHRDEGERGRGTVGRVPRRAGGLADLGNGFDRKVDWAEGNGCDVAEGPRLQPCLRKLSIRSLHRLLTSPMSSRSCPFLSTAIQAIKILHGHLGQ